jgi:hypothetical protein
MALPKIFSYEKVETALRESGGYVTTAADLLDCSPTTVRKYLRESKQLREILFETRERMLDLAESELHKLMMSDKNDKVKVTALIFYLKCQGKDRGWIDRADWVKPGASEKKPLYIKIMPVGGMVDGQEQGKRGRGRPKKDYIEVKVTPDQQPKMITGLKDEDIIDLEPMVDPRFIEQETI